LKNSADKPFPTQATTTLRKAGFERVANLADGMVRWRGQRLAVEGACD
jgi:rhodanese-related sulfurtransferase